MKDLIIHKSLLGGRGVFAEREFNNGEVVERCPVIVIDREFSLQIDATPLYNYYFLWGNNIALSLGYGSLYNHSFEPNVYYQKDLDNQELIFVALRDINKDEEFLINYNGDPLDQTPLWFSSK